MTGRTADRLDPELACGAAGKATALRYVDFFVQKVNDSTRLPFWMFALAFECILFRTRMCGIN
jgi:hypothetical protein